MTVIHIPEHQKVSAKLVQLLLLNEEKIRFISNLTRRVSVPNTHTHTHTHTLWAKFGSPKTLNKKRVIPDLLSFMLVHQN